jgi:chromosome partitioning protein
MRSIAVINQKGGVGKTTTAINVAAGLARRGQRVLLMDLDPQAHASLHLGVQLSNDEPNVYDVLTRRLSLAQICITIGERLSLVPASADLVGVDLQLQQQKNRERVLADALRPFDEAFDFCLVDCPPSLGLLTVCGLAAVQEVLIPLQPHFFALQGLGRLLETVTVVRRSLNPRLRVSGVVLCMYERGTRLAQEVADDVAQFLRDAGPADAWYGARVLETRVRRNIKLAECPSFGQTVFDYAPDSHGAEDYSAVAGEVLAMNTHTPAVASSTASESRPGTIIAERSAPAESAAIADASAQFAVDATNQPPASAPHVRETAP